MNAKKLLLVDMSGFLAGVCLLRRGFDVLALLHISLYCIPTHTHTHTHTPSLDTFSLTLVTTCRGRWSATITALRVFGEDLAVLVREITGFFESSILRLWDIDLCSHSMYSKVDIIPPQDSTPNRTRQVELIQ